MAGIFGLIDIQQLRQELGLSKYTIPSPAEVDKIAKESFGSAPTSTTKQAEYKFRSPTGSGLDADSFNSSVSKAQLGGQVMSLFYRSSGYSVGDLKFDLMLDEDHSFESLISSHPVEEGADITDHIQQLLQQGNLTGLISNHSIRGTDSRVIDRSDARTPSALGAGRAGSAWEICRRIWENQEPVTLVSCLDTYYNVGISKFGAHRDSDTGDALAIAVTFKQMRKVSLNSVTAVAVVSPGDMKTNLHRQAAATKSQGKVVGSSQTMDLGTGYISGVAK